MATKTYIRRFDRLDRIFHLFLMVTFLIQTATGFGRMYITTAWGKGLVRLFGGYETALSVHEWIGILMLAGFILHTVRLLARIDYRNWRTSLYGPDSLLPTHHDIIQFGQRIRWFFGLGPEPRHGRWSYWEKFDYWAVYWGMPLLAVTGIMLMASFWTTRWLPGWMLNIAALLHRAEAILAAAYIFIVHFSVGHLRPSSFPMNEAMFSGSMPLEKAREEKPAWIDRLQTEGRLETVSTAAPPVWYKALYLAFGYLALGFGVYLLINGLIYSRHVSLH